MKNKFTYSENRVTAIANDGYYLWIAFLGEDGISRLYKVSAFDPELRYYNLSITADEIKKIMVDTTYIYLALNSSYLGERLSKANPLGTYTYINKPVGITEKAVDLVFDNTHIYFLIPGEISETNTKIVRILKSNLSYVETIDLTTVNNATKIDIDESGRLWVVSEVDPIKLTKVYYDTAWHFTTYTLS